MISLDIAISGKNSRYLNNPFDIRKNLSISKILASISEYSFSISKITSFPASISRKHDSKPLKDLIRSGEVA
jgi:hypothetical protein